MSASLRRSLKLILDRVTSTEDKTTKESASSSASVTPRTMETSQGNSSTSASVTTSNANFTSSSSKSNNSTSSKSLLAHDSDDIIASSGPSTPKMKGSPRLSFHSGMIDLSSSPSSSVSSSTKVSLLPTMRNMMVSPRSSIDTPRPEKRRSIDELTSSLGDTSSGPKIGPANPKLLTIFNNNQTGVPVGSDTTTTTTSSSSPSLLLIESTLQTNALNSAPPSSSNETGTAATTTTTTTDTTTSATSSVVKKSGGIMNGEFDGVSKYPRPTKISFDAPMSILETDGSFDDTTTTGGSIDSINSNGGGPLLSLGNAFRQDSSRAGLFQPRFNRRENNRFNNNSSSNNNAIFNNSSSKKTIGGVVEISDTTSNENNNNNNNNNFSDVLGSPKKPSGRKAFASADAATTTTTSKAATTTAYSPPSLHSITDEVDDDDLSYYSNYNKYIYVEGCEEEEGGNDNEEGNNSSSLARLDPGSRFLNIDNNNNGNGGSYLLHSTSSRSKQLQQRQQQRKDEFAVSGRESMGAHERVQELLKHRNGRARFGVYLRRRLAGGDCCFFQGSTVMLRLDSEEVHAQALAILHQYLHPSTTSAATTTTTTSSKALLINNIINNKQPKSAEWEEATRLVSGLKPCDESAMLLVFQQVERTTHEVLKMSVLGALLLFVRDSTEYLQWVADELLLALSNSTAEPVAPKAVFRHKYHSFDTHIDADYIDRIKNYRETKRTVQRALERGDKLSADGEPLFPRPAATSTSSTNTTASTSSTLSSSSSSAVSKQGSSFDSIEDVCEHSLSNRAGNVFDLGFLDEYLQRSCWLRDLCDVFEELPFSLCLATTRRNNNNNNNNSNDDGVSFPLVYVNQHFLRMSGCGSKEEALGRSCASLLQRQEEDAVNAAAIAAMRAGLSDAKAVRVVVTNSNNKSGRRFQQLVALKPLFDQQGRYRFVVGCQFALNEYASDDDDHNDNDKEKDRNELSQAYVWLMEQLLRLIPDHILLQEKDSPL